MPRSDAQPRFGTTRHPYPLAPVYGAHRGQSGPFPVARTVGVGPRTRKNPPPLGGGFSVGGFGWLCGGLDSHVRITAPVRRMKLDRPERLTHHPPLIDHRKRFPRCADIGNVR